MKRYNQEDTDKQNNNKVKLNPLDASKNQLFSTYKGKSSPKAVIVMLLVIALFCVLAFKMGAFS